MWQEKMSTIKLLVLILILIIPINTSKDFNRVITRFTPINLSNRFINRSNMMEVRKFKKECSGYTIETTKGKSITVECIYR